MMGDTVMELTNGGAILMSEFGIRSAGLKETCPLCESEDCENFHHETTEERYERKLGNAAIDGVESLLLALAGEQVISLEDTRVRRAVEAALDAIGNNL